MRISLTETLSSCLQFSREAAIHGTSNKLKSLQAQRKGRIRRQYPVSAFTPDTKGALQLVANCYIPSSAQTKRFIYRFRHFFSFGCIAARAQSHAGEAALATPFPGIPFGFADLCLAARHGKLCHTERYLFRTNLQRSSFFQMKRKSTGCRQFGQLSKPLRILPLPNRPAQSSHDSQDKVLPVIQTSVDAYVMTGSVPFHFQLHIFQPLFGLHFIVCGG